MKSDVLTHGRRKLILGLLGGIGSGKSLVARLLGGLGCGVIDADELARAALDEPPVREQLVAWWGPAILDDLGHVDRKRVAAIVFGDRAQLDRLEGVVHPRVNQRRQELRAGYQADPSVVAIVEDVPLLLEKGLDEGCDFLIFVDASRENRLRRVAAGRGWSAEELARREKNQMGLDIKAQRADYVISNDDGEAECLLHVRRVLSQILQDQA